MSKRVQEGAGKERLTAKSKPMMNLVSKTVGKSSMSLSSSASNSREQWKHKISNWVSLRIKPCTQRFKWGRSFEFSSVANGCKSEPKCRETCAHRKDSESHWLRSATHNFQMFCSPSVVGHLEKVFLNLRQKICHEPKDDYPSKDTLTEGGFGIQSGKSM